MNELLEIVGLACLVNLLVEAEPIKRLKAWLGITEDSTNSFVSFLARLLGCCLCLGTYVGMICMWSVPLGAIVAVVAQFINKKLNETTL